MSIFDMFSGIFGGGKSMTAAEAAEKIKTLDKYAIVDIREPEEYVEGVVEGATFIPQNKLESEITKAVPDKTTTVFVYCYSGGRASGAVAALKSMGYENAYNIGGISVPGFQKAFPLVKK